MKAKRVNVRVTRKNDLLPLNFPWLNGVDLNVLSDISILANLENEIKAIKAMVNTDANKFSIPLSQLNIIVEFK